MPFRKALKAAEEQRGPNFGVARRQHALSAGIRLNPRRDPPAGKGQNRIGAGKISGMDDDLNQMSREQLEAEVRRLRQGIRKHRDSTGHELCWHHPELWALLPERTDPSPVVPDWPQFLQGCIRYRESLDKQAPDLPRSHDSFGG